MKAALRILPRVTTCRRPLSSSPPLPPTEPAPKPFSEMPGLKGLPVVGNIPMLIKEIRIGKGGTEDVMYRLQSKFGPIFRMKMLGNRWWVYTSSPEAAEVVFRSEGKYPSRGDFEANMKWIFNKLKLPLPMFFSTGEEWKKTRSNAAKQVVPRRVGSFVEPLSVIAEELLSHFETLQDEAGNVQDIRDEMYKWAFQGVSYFVYGEKIDIYSGADAVQTEFIEAGMAYVQILAEITLALPIYRLFPTKTFRDYERIVRRMNRAGQVLLDRRRDKIKDAILSGTVDETKAVGLLDQWMIEGKFTEEEALSQSYDMMSAGIDTTSNSACFLLYEIARHPDIQERLMQEISSVVGDKEHPSWEDLQKMTLVRNCVKETMRMYMPLSAILRVMERDTVILGYQVPAGTTVGVNMNYLSRNETIFDNPRSFIPDRWQKSNSNPFSSLPFGFGPRACYGRRLAELELYLLLAKMLPKYQLRTNIENMKVKVQVLLKPNLPLQINFQKRV